MTAEGCMVQRSPARSIRHIHIAEQWDECFSAADSFICCGDVKRRLPVLVSGVYVCRVFQQHLDSLLQEVITRRFNLHTVWICKTMRNSARNTESGDNSHTSLQEATARCRGVSHLLSLAFTLAPKSQRTPAVRLCKVIQLHDN